MRLIYNLAILISVFFIFGSQTIPVEAQNTVRENIFWNYDVISIPWGYPLDEDAAGYHFKGHENHEGKDYSVFRDKAGDKTALMREEDGKIYVYDIPEGSETNGRELLLFDFSKNVGEEYTVYTCDYTGCQDYWKITVRVTDISYIEYNEERYRCQHVDTFLDDDFQESTIFIEGVGAICGLLPFPQYGILTSGGKAKCYHISSMEDNNGKLLFKMSDTPLEVSPITKGRHIPASDRIFDLQGRELSEPIPGQPYIKGGHIFLEK